MRAAMNRRILSILSSRATNFVVAGFLTFAFLSDARAGNLQNCYAPRDSKTPGGAVTCAPEGPKVYPDPVQKGPGGTPKVVKINGCYNWKFERVRDIPGDAISGRCTDTDAPLRYYLSYRTFCSKTDSTGGCTYGSTILVYPNFSVDGPNPFGDGFNPMTTFNFPIKIGKGIASYSAAESCEVLSKPKADGTPSGYEFDEATQTCFKTPAKLCADMGFYWSSLDEKCITGDDRAIHGNGIKCSTAVCAAATSPSELRQRCLGDPFVPTGQNCYCQGASESLDRKISSAAPGDKGACQWLHYEVQLNPMCEKWNSNVEYVADPSDPSKDRCCTDGSCDGFSAIDSDNPSAAARISTTAKHKNDNPASARQFLQIGPDDKYPNASVGKGLNPALRRQ